MKMEPTCLLQELSYSDFKATGILPLERCEIIARLANIRITFNQTLNPGIHLVKTLDRLGFKVQQYKEYLTIALNTKIFKTYYKPYSKVAILIANDRYTHLSRLATPSIDCDSLGAQLKNLGFIVISIKNTRSAELKGIIEKVFEMIEENSYCFIFYAGHGCEICNTKCILSIDCPTENMTGAHCVTENFILNAVAKCKPELCVLIMDMCTVNLERTSNPHIYESILSTPPIKIHKNLLVAYSTSSSASAYELIEIECSQTIDDNATYEIKTGDTDRIVPNASQYVNALCTRLTDDLDVSSLLDKIHYDVENSLKKQRPIKVQCGNDKRSLHDPVTGDLTAALNKLKEISKDWKEVYNVF